jgi:hypothetical protein
MEHRGAVRGNERANEGEAAISSHDIRDRVKQLQDKTGDLCDTLDRIEKRWEEATSLNGAQAV